jgi:hypothetical protein
VFRFFAFEDNDNVDSRRMPSLFYEGVMFGISSLNSFDVDFTGSPPRSSLTSLHSDLEDLSPSFVVDRLATCNQSVGWRDEGFAVYFSYRDLAASGRLGGDHRLPGGGRWARVSEGRLTIV